MENTEIKRPELLGAFCFLTFIGSGLGFIAYFMASLFFGKASELIVKISSWHTTEAISPLYFTLFMAFSAISLAGAIRMWKLHRDGFYMYVFAQISMLFLTAIWIGWPAFSSVNAIFTVIFIAGYGFHYKKFQ